MFPLSENGTYSNSAPQIALFVKKKIQKQKTVVSVLLGPTAVQSNKIRRG